MPSIHLYWLGPPVVEQDGKPVRLETRKALAMLAYLSLEKSNLPREVLATMLWPEYDQQHAMANLRRNLTSLNNGLVGNWIAADRETIGLRTQVDCCVDVDDFRQQLNIVQLHHQANEELCPDCLGSLENGVRLYRGDFLQGFNLRDSPQFDDWQYFLREDLRNNLALMLERLVDACILQSHYDLAINHARRWVYLDCLNERAQCQLMRSFAFAGMRSAAIRQYEELEQLIEGELGQKPEDETTQLYHQIRNSDLEARPVKIPALPVVPVQPEQSPPSTTSVEPILQIKLFVPATRTNLVQRPRLLALLDEGAKYSLTLVSAPAGFGKSTLLAEWTKQASTPVAWLSLDSGDNDPVRFLAYFIAAIEHIYSGVGSSAQKMLRASQQLPVQTVLVALISAIEALSEPFVLVLDDYQFISTQQIHAGVAYLLDHLPSNLHLIVSSRSDPPLQLSRLRGRDQLYELRSNELRFTPDEASQFLNRVMKLGLSSEDIRTLEARTEGWIVGLQMAALSLQGREDAPQFIRTFSGSHRYILDYLVQEVLNHHPEDVQKFLLRTSILERMCGSLCDELLGSTDGSSQQILEYLDRSNLFVIPLDEMREWYRYHHLFAELLRSRLHASNLGKGKENVQALHIRAAHWFDEHGYEFEGIAHALASEDYQFAADLIEKGMWNILSQSRLTQGLKWLEELPQEIIHGRPWLCIQYARFLCMLGRLEEVEPLLQKAEQFVLSKPCDSENRILSGHIAMVRSNQAFFMEDVLATIQYARQALEDLPEDQIVSRFMTLLLLGHGCFINDDTDGEAAVWQEASRMMEKYPHIPISFIIVLGHAHGYHLYVQGRLMESYELYARNISMLQESNSADPVALGLMHLGLAHNYREWDDLEKALFHAETCLRHLENCGDTEYHVLAAMALERVKWAQRDWNAAFDLLRLAEDLVQRYHVSHIVSAWVSAELIRYHLERGDLEPAQQWIQRNHLAVDDKLTFDREYEHMIFARVLTAQEKFDEALTLLERLAQAAQSTRRTGRLVEILVLRALTLRASEENNLALTVLQEALNIACPEGFMRIFLDEGAPLVDMLRSGNTGGNWESSQISDYVDRLLQAADR